MTESAEETSLKAASLNEIAFDMAPVGIVMTENRVIRACNLAFAAMFGYPREELIESILCDSLPVF